MYDYYTERPFKKGNNNFDMEPNVRMMNRILVREGLKLNDSYQIIGGISVFPTDYFCPLDNLRMLHKTKNTYVIHYFEKTWGKTTEDEKKWYYEERKRERRKHWSNYVVRILIGRKAYEYLKQKKDNK